MSQIIKYYSGTLLPAEMKEFLCNIFSVSDSGCHCDHYVHHAVESLQCMHYVFLEGGKAKDGGSKAN